MWWCKQLAERSQHQVNWHTDWIGTTGKNKCCCCWFCRLSLFCTACVTKHRRRAVVMDYFSNQVFYQLLHQFIEYTISHSMMVAYPVFFFLSCTILLPSVYLSIPLRLCTLQSTYLFLISFFSLPFLLVLVQHKWQQLRMTLPSPWQPCGPVCVCVCWGKQGECWGESLGNVREDGRKRRE